MLIEKSSDKFTKTANDFAKEGSHQSPEDQLTIFKNTLEFYFLIKKQWSVQSIKSRQRPIVGDVQALCLFGRFFRDKVYFLRRICKYCDRLETHELAARLPEIIPLISELLESGSDVQKREALSAFRQFIAKDQIFSINQSMIRIIRSMSESIRYLFSDNNHPDNVLAYQFLLKDILPLCHRVGFHIGLKEGFLGNENADAMLPESLDQKKSAYLKQLAIRNELIRDLIDSLYQLNPGLPGLDQPLKHYFYSLFDPKMKSNKFRKVSNERHISQSFDLDEFYGKLKSIESRSEASDIVNSDNSESSLVNALAEEIFNAPIVSGNGVDGFLKLSVLKSLFMHAEASISSFKERIGVMSRIMGLIGDLTAQQEGLLADCPDQIVSLDSQNHFRYSGNHFGLNASFFYELGAWFNHKEFLKFLSQGSLSRDQKNQLVFGHIFPEMLIWCSKNAGPNLYYSEQDINRLIKYLNSEQILEYEGPEDLWVRLASQTHLPVESCQWKLLIGMAGHATGQVERRLPLIFLLTTLIRLKKILPEGDVDPINIEEIPKDLGPLLAKMLVWTPDLGHNYPVLRSFLRVLPLDSFLINEIRIKVYILFRDSPAKARFQDILRYIMHDSPSPYHLEIMKVFVEYLETGRKEERLALDQVMLPFKDIYDPDEEDRQDRIEVPEDYIHQLGSSYSLIRKTAIEVRDLYEDLYGQQQARAIVRTLIDQKNQKYIDNVPDLKKSIIYFLNEISRHQIEGMSVPNGMAKYFKTFNLHKFSQKKRFELLSQMVEIRGAVQNLIRSCDLDGAGRVYFVRLQNSLEPVCFGLISSFSDGISDLGQGEKTILFLSLVRSIQADLGWDCLDFKELSLIEKELYVLNKSSDYQSRFYGILLRIERVIYRLSSELVMQYQRRAEELSATFACELKVVRDFSADMIRESVLYVASLLTEKMIRDYCIKNHLSAWHVTRSGMVGGSLRYFENNEALRNANLERTDIIVIPSIDPQGLFPMVGGIVTLQKEGSLSHLAILAGYHQIPWVTPEASVFRDLRDKILIHGQAFGVLTASGDVVDLHLCDHGEAINTQIDLKGDRKRESGISCQPIKVDRNEFYSKDVVHSPEYTEALVGPKAYKLKVLGELLPGVVPWNVSLSFGFFSKLTDRCERLRALRQKIYLEPESAANLLKSMRQEILGFKFSRDICEKILSSIRGSTDQSFPMIVRSSTNCEDLEGYPGAGIYHSVPDVSDDSLFHAIREVWSSFYTEKAYLERRREGFKESQSFPAVIIQEMFRGPSLHSFVIHTSSPLSGDHEAMIEIAKGFGEAVVGSDEVFSGSPHRFTFDKLSGKLRRNSYANKSFYQVNGELRLADYSDDPMSSEELPYELFIKNLFLAALTIEGNQAHQYEKAQDIEGAFVFGDQGPEFCFVQTRQQIGKASNPAPKSPSEKMINKGEENPTASWNYPFLFPPKQGSNRTFDLPKGNFFCDNTNLIEMWLSAFARVTGEKGSVVIRPYGSLSYLQSDESVLWELIDDFDLIFYLPSCSSHESAWEFEKKYSTAIKEAFMEIAGDAGLSLGVTGKDRFAIHGRAGSGERSWEMKDVNLKYLPLTEYFCGKILMREPSGFLPWSLVYSDPVGHAKVYYLALNFRPVTAEKIVKNCEEQYAFAWHRAAQDSGLRKLKELKRLAPLQNLETLDSQVSRLLKLQGDCVQFKDDDVCGLWEQLPTPGSGALRSVQAIKAKQLCLNSERFITGLDNRLRQFEVVLDQGVYYSFGFPDDTRIPELLANVLIRSWVDSATVYFMSLFSRYSDRVIDFMVLIIREFLNTDAKVAHWLSMKMIQGTLRDFDHSLSRSSGEPLWYSEFPELTGRGDDVSVMDIVQSFLKNKGGIRNTDRIVMDHIDLGCLSVVPLLLSRSNCSLKLLNLIHRASDLHEKPQVGEAETESRFEGEDVNAQLLVLSVAKLIKPVRTKKMSESEAIRFMRGDVISGSSVLETICDLAKQLYRGHRESNLLARNHFKSLKQQRNKCKIQTDKIYEVFANGQVVFVHDRHGIQDTGLKYTYMPVGATILIQFSELLDQEKKILGWRYHSLGRDPRQNDVSLEGLTTMLNLREEQLHKEARALRVQRWVTKTHGSVVCFGPVGNDPSNVSKIPPNELAEICMQMINR